MLVLSRKLQQEIIIGDNVKITVLKVRGNTVRLGIEAPRSVRVVRGELPPIETPSAEVTVVFDHNSVESSVRTSEPNTDQESADVVPFRLPTEDRRLGKTENRLDPTSISFRENLPSTLSHNRLRQIVSEISNRVE